MKKGQTKKRSRRMTRSARWDSWDRLWRLGRQVCQEKCTEQTVRTLERIEDRLDQFERDIERDKEVAEIKTNLEDLVSRVTELEKDRQASVDPFDGVVVK